MNHFTKKNNKSEKLRGIYFQLGLIVAGGLTLVAFEWTTPVRIATLGGEIVEEIEWDLDYVEPFEIEKEEIVEEKIEPPKVDLNKIEVIPDDKIVEKEINQTEEVKTKKVVEFKEGDWKEKEIIKEEAPKSFAQHMPHYKTCADLSETERKSCTQQEMYKHFGKKLRIPATIKMKGAANYMAFVYFEVNKKGRVTNVKILNDNDHKIPKELEREAYAAVSSLPEFIPAKDNGRKVKVLYRLPISFTVR